MLLILTSFVDTFTSRACPKLELPRNEGERQTGLCAHEIAFLLVPVGAANIWISEGSFPSVHCNGTNTQTKNRHAQKHDQPWPLCALVPASMGTPQPSTYTHIRTYIHTCIHTQIHTYIFRLMCISSLCRYGVLDLSVYYFPYSFTPSLNYLFIHSFVN